MVGQKLFFDLVGSRTLDSSRAAEAALRQALELARGSAGDIAVRRSAKSACLTGRASFAGGQATIEAWPATGYVAVDVSCDRGLRPELLLMGLMDAFAAREGQIKRRRSATDGARYKKAVATAAPAPAVKPARALAERGRAERTKARRAA